MEQEDLSKAPINDSNFSDFSDSFDSQKGLSMPKKTKNKFFSISKSKIDWNNKYNFPKKNNPI